MNKLQRVVLHGVSGYQRGCRCDTCRVSWRDYHREWMHAHPEHVQKHAESQLARYYASKAQNQDTAPASRQDA